MSRFSHEHHVRAPQQAVLEQMETFFRGKGCQAFEITLLPLEMEERQAFATGVDLAGVNQIFYVVSPTDAEGWTILWGGYRAYHQEKLIAFLSEQLRTTALYGHNNDQVDDSRWILFQNGEEVASYWYLGREDQMWVNWPDLYVAPEGAMEMWEAFEAQGRKYYHQSLHSVIVLGWRETSLPIEQFRFVSIVASSGTI